MLHKITKTFIICLISFYTYGQVGIGTVTPNAALEINSNNQGVIIPRVSLTSTNTSAPIINPAGGALLEGTLVYNIAIAGTPPNNVLPGFYYWKDSSWIAVSPSGDNLGSHIATQDLDLVKYQIFFKDVENNNANVILTGSDAAFPDDGVTLRTLTNPINGEPIFRVMSSGGAERLRVEHNGNVSINNGLLVTGLSGSGTRMVVANDAGQTSTQVIPAGDITSVIAGSGLTGGTVSGSVILNADANNGINVNAVQDKIQLGGSLTMNTTIVNETYDLDINLNNTGDFRVRDNGNPALAVIDNGNVGINTEAPSNTLDVDGYIEVGNQNSGGANVEGAMRYNNSRKCMQFYDGSSWRCIGEPKVQTVIVIDGVNETLNGTGNNVNNWVTQGYGKIQNFVINDVSANARIIFFVEVVNDDVDLRANDGFNCSYKLYGNGLFIQYDMPVVGNNQAQNNTFVMQGITTNTIAGNLNFKFEVNTEYTNVKITAIHY